MARIEYKLSPCPFCGSETAPTLMTAQETESCAHFDYESCPCFDTDRECPVALVVCDLTKGGCGASSGFRMSKGEAANDWNQRAAAPEPKESKDPEQETGHEPELQPDPGQSEEPPAKKRGGLKKIKAKVRKNER